jgi:hypothetical protein
MESGLLRFVLAAWLISTACRARAQRSAQAWLTNADRSALLQKQKENLHFSSARTPNQKPTIQINDLKLPGSDHHRRKRNDLQSRLLHGRAFFEVCSAGVKAHRFQFSGHFAQRCISRPPRIVCLGSREHSGNGTDVQRCLSRKGIRRNASSGLPRNVRLVGSHPIFMKIKVFTLG